jgi:hypothetical protein
LKAPAFFVDREARASKTWYPSWSLDTRDNSGSIPELVFQQYGISREIINPEFFALLQQQARL